MSITQAKQSNHQRETIIQSSRGIISAQKKSPSIKHRIITRAREVNTKRKRPITMISIHNSPVLETANGSGGELGAAPSSPHVTSVAGPSVPLYVEFPTKRLAVATIPSTSGDVFQGGIVSDDDTSCWELADNIIDDENQSNATAGVDLLDDEVRPIDDGEECMDEEMEEMMSLEPLDYRTPPRYESFIQNTNDWELMRPMLLKIMYTR
uniref:Uncharacterized protein n=1 Tax=Odontella aurita TaxID=265563 RepID=A0A7S4HRM9_9STRA|mmetsp:Transcript_14000/g.41004  ORF Transcript_14000/g.41004 Transcript_14000/m.41004 type:complete len:209 (+) Transcript_14000:255-881(+)